MALRGFDDYQVTLGDEMRGERASLGVSLADVEHDLKIRSKTILAIENCDLSGFPMESVVAGYVRSYARYLGMDPENAFLRFCEESGFRSPAMQVRVTESGPLAARVALNSRAGENIGRSRFSPPSAPKRIGAVVPLGAIASGIALVAVATGLGLGGWHVLQDIQRVGVTDAEPEVVAEIEAPVRPVVEVGTLPNRPSASVYDEDGILARAGGGQDLAPPQLASRDGPISEINPRDAGLYASAVNQLDRDDPRNAPAQDAAPAWNRGVVLASLATDSVPSDAERLTMSAGAAAETSLPRNELIFVHAAEEAWIRIKDTEGTIVFEGIVAAGDRVALPEGIETADLRAGNAGAVFVLIGDQAYGPVGKPGRVVKNVTLEAAQVRQTFPAAELKQPPAEEQMQRAEADLTR